MLDSLEQILSVTISHTLTEGAQLPRELNTSLSPKLQSGTDQDDLSLIGHFPKKRLIICGSFAENDVQLKVGLGIFHIMSPK